MGLEPCTGEGAHACGNPASHRGRWPWLADVPYVAHVADPPSPSALPPRRSAVMGAAAALRGLPPREMFAVADRMHDGLFSEFRRRKEEAAEALPMAARGLVACLDRLAGGLEAAGLFGQANAVRRGTYRRLGLEAAARGLEEVAAGYTAAIDERIGGGQLCGRRLPLFRHAEAPEALSMARSGALSHHGGKDHLSFSLYLVDKYRHRPVLLELALTGNARPRLRALAYRSRAFGAPGSRPLFRERWAGTKSWGMAKECEVRLRTPVPVSGLDLAVRLRDFPGERAWRALRGLCGARKVAVPGPRSPDL